MSPKEHGGWNAASTECKHRLMLGRTTLSQDTNPKIDGRGFLFLILVLSGCRTEPQFIAISCDFLASPASYVGRDVLIIGSVQERQGEDDLFTGEDCNGRTLEFPVVWTSHAVRSEAVKPDPKTAKSKAKVTIHGGSGDVRFSYGDGVLGVGGLRGRFLMRWSNGRKRWYFESHEFSSVGPGRM